MPPAAPLDALALPHPPTALVGLAGTGKSTRLRDRYEALLRGGTPAERVLVWVANAAEATTWRQAIKGFDFHHGETQVVTFRAWVRRELTMNWPIVEASGLLPGAPEAPAPMMVGLTAAQQILKDTVELIAPRFEALDRCSTLPIHRLIQVLDTYARLVEHGLPAHEAAARLDRGHRLSNDSAELHRFIGEAIDHYRQFCFRHRVLDYTLQLELFHRALWGHAGYREALARSLDLLIVDNLEESLPVAQAVASGLAEAGASLLVARDLNGGLREYLGGDPRGADAMLERCTVHLLEGVRRVPPAMAELGSALAAVVLAGHEAAPPAPITGLPLVLHPHRTLRVQMFEAVGRRLRELLNAGTPQGEIVIIAPVVDPLLAWHLRGTLAAEGKALRVVAGSNRVIDHRPVRILVTLARLARPEWNRPPTKHDVAEALETLLDLHPLEGPHLQGLVYPDKGAALAPDAVEWPKHLAGRREAYTKVFAWITEASAHAAPLDRLFEDAFAKLYAPRRLTAMAPDPALSGREPGEPYRWNADQALEILQIDQLIQGARSYRQLARVIEIPEIEIPLRFLRSIYAGELAERPLIPPGVLPEAVTLSTAAKYAEEGPPARVQLWVDAASPQWAKSDVRELMNPRVLSRHWDQGAYSDAHDQRHQAEKLARTLHTIALKATGAIEVFASDYGSDGAELGGELPYWLAELSAAGQEVTIG